MKILVTGGAGFIGSNFILYWLKNNPQDQVVNLDKLTYAGNLKNLEGIQGEARYKFVKGDICNGQLVSSLMEGIDLVVHFAAESHVDRSILQPGEFVSTNVIGTHVLLENALKAGVKRFHHISTDEVFGSLRLDDPNKFTEDTPYNPRSPYAATKAASDHLVRAYFYTYGLPVTISNCSNNFGPYQFPEKLIPLAVTNVLEGKKIPVYGDGKNVRDWLYVEDHCRALEVILKKGKIGETYLVGASHEEVSNLEVIKKILKILKKGEELIEFIKDRPGHDRRYAIDWSKINKELDWQPKFGFDQALKKTIEWYIENKLWWQRVKTGEYQKYYQLQYK